MIRTFRPGDEPAILAVVDAALTDRPAAGQSLAEDIVYAVERHRRRPRGHARRARGRHDRRLLHAAARRRDRPPRPSPARPRPAAGGRGAGSRPIARPLAPRPLRDDRPRAGGRVHRGPRLHVPVEPLAVRAAPSVEVPAPTFPGGRRRPSVSARIRPDGVRRARQRVVPRPPDAAALFGAGDRPRAWRCRDFDPDGILFVSPRDEPDRPIAWAKVVHDLSEDGDPARLRLAGSAYCRSGGAAGSDGSSCAGASRTSGPRARGRSS